MFFEVTGEVSDKVVKDIQNLELKDGERVPKEQKIAF